MRIERRTTATTNMKKENAGESNGELRAIFFISRETECVFGAFIDFGGDA